MTLVLSLVTNDFLIQVADRRLTRGTTVVTDAATKAVVYCNFMVLGYTGLADILGERTDIWITKQLAEPRMMSPWAVARKLRVAASVAFGKMDPFPHAFTAIGWLKEREGEPFLPFIMRVSNYHDSAGTQLSRPSHLFSARLTAFAQPNFFHVSVTGQHLTKAELVRLRRAIMRARARGVGQSGTVQLLAHQIRQVATPTGTVGKDLLATCFPLGAVRNGYAPPDFIMKGRPSLTHMTFLDLPQKRSDVTWYHPHVVSPGVRITNLRLEKHVAPSRGPEQGKRAD